MPSSTGGSRSCIPTLWSKTTLDSFSIPQKVGITCHTQKSAHSPPPPKKKNNNNKKTKKQKQKNRNSFEFAFLFLPWKVKKQEQRNRKFPSKSLLCGNMRCSTGSSKRPCIRRYETRWSLTISASHTRQESHATDKRQNITQSPSNYYLTDRTVSDKVGPSSGPAFHLVTPWSSHEVHMSTGHRESGWRVGVGSREAGRKVYLGV